MGFGISDKIHSGMLIHLSIAIELNIGNYTKQKIPVLVKDRHCLFIIPGQQDLGPGNAFGNFVQFVFSTPATVAEPG